MTREELEAVLDKHKKWLAGQEDGVRADLNCVDLSYACLRRANLIEARLSGADLRRADLRGADLNCADLRCADLSWADLREARLSGTDLRKADLRGADLRGANLDYSCWPLWCGSLTARIDKRIACQLLYHTLRAMQSVDDQEVQAVCNDPRNIALANQFHRAEECGRIEPKSEDTKEAK